MLQTCYQGFSDSACLKSTCADPSQVTIDNERKFVVNISIFQNNSLRDPTLLRTDFDVTIKNNTEAMGKGRTSTQALVYPNAKVMLHNYV